MTTIESSSLPDEWTEYRPQKFDPFGWMNNVNSFDVFLVSIEENRVVRTPTIEFGPCSLSIHFHVGLHQPTVGRSIVRAQTMMKIDHHIVHIGVLIECPQTISDVWKSKETDSNSSHEWQIEDGNDSLKCLETLLIDDFQTVLPEQPSQTQPC